MLEAEGGMLRYLETLRDSFESLKGHLECAEGTLRVLRFGLRGETPRHVLKRACDDYGHRTSDNFRGCSPFQIHRFDGDGEGGFST